MHFEKSNAYLQRALRVTPGGAQTLSKQACRFPAGAFPLFAEHCYGAVIVDPDGNEFIDYICGLGAVTLGYGMSGPQGEVASAIMNRACLGITPSLPTKLEAEIAERLCAIIPCAEQVRFCKTGSESTEAAIRVARMATGRDIILTVKGGYHSWHSWFAATRDERPGVPQEYEELVWTFPYNNLEKFERIFTNAAEHAAAVIMEPCLFEAPEPGFLEGVRDLCHQNGALFILDEMLCGFRWARAGGSEYFNIEPDLACYGKGLANGMPLACLVGKAE